MSDAQDDGCGCGCLGIVIAIFLLHGLFWPIPTPWGSFSYDLFPPAINQHDAVEESPND